MPDDSDRSLFGQGSLFGQDLAWDLFLCRVGSDGDSPRRAFVARNFILDEGIGSERVDTYRALRAAEGHADFQAWKERHGAYLSEKIQLPYWVEPLDSRDEDVCPETFRASDRHAPFESTDRHLHLIRVEMADTIADLVRPRFEVSALLGLANDVVGGRAIPEARAELEDLLAKWLEVKDSRPVYCGFFADLEDLFKRGKVGWADALRDRLGLAHLDPGERGKPIDILVFKYPVSQVTRVTGAAPGTRPLVPPTVLDGGFSEAFCPAPGGELTGHVVNLSLEDQEERRLRNALLRREILHPKTRLKAKHLFRVGRIEVPVDFENLPFARAVHLDQVRAASGRDDYARGTDKDLP